MIFLTQNLENQNHKTMAEAQSDPEKASSSQSVQAIWGEELWSWVRLVSISVLNVVRKTTCK